MVPAQPIAANRVESTLSESQVTALMEIRESFSPALRSSWHNLGLDPSHDCQEVLEQLDRTLEVVELLGISQATILNVMPNLDRTKSHGALAKVGLSKVDDYDRLSSNAQKVWNALVQRGYQPFLAKFSQLSNGTYRLLLCVRTSNSSFATVEPLQSVQEATD